jgi:hypothetical protein
MLRILSFDVGMKNLAYCLFQVGEKCDDYKVLKWDVINLCTPIVKKCNNGDAQLCNNDAKYCKIKKSKGGDDGDGGADGDDGDDGDDGGDEGHEIGANEILNIEYYCKKHAKKSNLKVPTSELDIKKIRKSKLVDIHGIIDKYQIPELQVASSGAETQRQKNTKDIFISMIQRELDKNYLDVIENVRAPDIDLVTLGENMMKELDKIVIPYNNDGLGRLGGLGGIGGLGGMGLFSGSSGLGGLAHHGTATPPDKYKIDIVIIENQISTIASRMKTLQGMIAQYFIMKYVPCIEFISAANKLKMFMTKKKTTYTERKLESVEVTKNLLETLPQFNEYKGYLDKNKKKDDLADCFLQGIYYLTLKNMIKIDYTVVDES